MLGLFLDLITLEGWTALALMQTQMVMVIEKDHRRHGEELQKECGHGKHLKKDPFSWAERLHGEIYFHACKILLMQPYNK